jgi:hypothetical protein
MYLTRAECLARRNQPGDKDDALTDLNKLLQNRYTVAFVAVTAANSTDALVRILLERRKELIFRGQRWIDVKRLNKEGLNINLLRIVNGQSFILLPNSNYYALPLPKDIVDIASGILQNPQ